MTEHEQPEAPEAPETIEAPADESSTDDVVSDEASADDAVGDEASADDAVGDEASADDAVGDEASADDAVDDEVSADEALGDETSTDDAVADDTEADPSASAPVPEDQEPPAAPARTAADISGPVEALLLLADDPVSETSLAQTLDVPVDVVNACLQELVAFYDETRRGFELRHVGEGWRYYTRAEHADVITVSVLEGQQSRLSQAALETLAVVAYQQPISRGRISAVRGVNVDGVIRTLLARGLLEEAGADEESGAAVFRTTSYFLERMGLKSLDELPDLAPHLPEVDELEAELGRLAAVPDASEQPAADEPVAEDSVSAEPVVDEPVSAEPVVDEPVSAEPVVDDPVADDPVADDPVADEPVADESVSEEPLVDHADSAETPSETDESADLTQSDASVDDTHPSESGDQQ